MTRRATGEVDRDRIEREMRALEEHLPADNPPLLSVVILANGAGYAFTYPLAESAKLRGAGEAHAVLTVVRAALLDLAASLQASVLDIERAQLQQLRQNNGR